MDTQTRPPFPDGRIYAAVVIELCQDGWSLRSCPVCNAESAILRKPNHDACYLCCPVCQRFTMTGSTFKAIEAWADRSDGAQLRDRLSRNLAVAAAPVYVDGETAWALANLVSEGD